MYVCVYIYIYILFIYLSIFIDMYLLTNIFSICIYMQVNLHYQALA